LNSEKEVKATESDKKQFLGEETGSSEMEEQPLTSALFVGGAYIVGAMVPVLPVLFGAKDALASLLTAGSMIVLVSTLLAFLSGMDIKRRIAMNLVIITIAVAVTYALGTLARTLWGVSV
jgi:VIT1/CCC1 family predicted Fe2+/Mn2+ transporter